MKEVKNVSKRDILFAIISVILFFLLLEYGAGKFLLKLFFPNDFVLDNHPLIELKSGQVQFREDLFNNFQNFYTVGIKKPRHFLSIKGIFTFDNKEGKVSTNFGDFVVNKWGTRGPYFAPNKKKINRIVAVGGSTTLGWWVGNENTYPRLLERMLNNKFNLDQYFQVINAGMYYHDSCDVKRKFLSKLVKFNPDILLFMSGWNDIEKLKTPGIVSKKEYCPKTSFLNQLNSYRFMKSLLQPKKTDSRKKHKSTVLDRNMSFFKENIEFIAGIAKDRNIKIGLVSLPTVLDKWSTIGELSTIPQVKKDDTAEIDYIRKAGLKINETYQNIAKENDHVFYIKNIISFNSRGKTLFFSDLVHQTEAGNRLQAYSIYQKLNKLLKIHLGKTAKQSDTTEIDKNQLELEYLKSIFATNKIEDLIFSGCVSFHFQCNTGQHKFENNVFTSMVLEFTLGSILQFRKQLNDHEIIKYYEKFLLKSIQLTPNFSLTYWVLSILKTIQGDEWQSTELRQKAINLNPKLKNISFEKEYSDFQKRHVKNPFLKKLSNLLFLLKNAPTYTASYTFFRSLKGKADLSLERRQQLTGFLYYSTPLLAKSIFTDYIKYLIKNGNRPLASSLLSKLTVLHPDFIYEDN